jgi:tetratricopeptide (TPR) repeat protein
MNRQQLMSDPTMDPLERTRKALERLRGILGHLAEVERRLQSQLPVGSEELTRSAHEIEELKELAEQLGPRSDPWDVFYRKYSALLHEHLKAAGLHPSDPSPRPWDFDAALKEVRNYLDRVTGSAAGFAGSGSEPEELETAIAQLADLAKILADLGNQQDHLEKQAQELLARGDRRGAIQRLNQAVDLFDRRRDAIGDEQQLIFFAKEGTYLYQKLLLANLELGDRAAALEVVERLKARGLQIVMGFAPLRRSLASSALSRREETLLAEARRLLPTIWSSAVEGQGERGFALWGRMTELRRELDLLWAEMGREPASAEYVSLRRGTSPDFEAIRGCLR